MQANATSKTLCASSFSPDHVAWWLAIGFLVAITTTPVYLWRRRDQFQSVAYGLIIFMFWNILFVSAAGILLDLGENNRTRFGIDPFILLLNMFFVLQLTPVLNKKIKKDPGV